jgi:hypothetical protein
VLIVGRHHAGPLARREPPCLLAPPLHALASNHRARTAPKSWGRGAGRGRTRRPLSSTRASSRRRSWRRAARSGGGSASGWALDLLYTLQSPGSNLWWSSFDCSFICIMYVRAGIGHV